MSSVFFQWQQVRHLDWINDGRYVLFISIPSEDAVEDISCMVMASQPATKLVSGLPWCDASPDDSHFPYYGSNFNFHPYADTCPIEAMCQAETLPLCSGVGRLWIVVF